MVLSIAVPEFTVSSCSWTVESSSVVPLNPRPVVVFVRLSVLVPVKRPKVSDVKLRSGMLVAVTLVSISISNTPDATDVLFAASVNFAVMV